MNNKPLDTNKWFSVADRPLYVKDNGRWVCTVDGSGEFIAAIPYVDKSDPTDTNLWWIRHCVVEDVVGLCVVGDGSNDPAIWKLEDVVYWAPWVSPPAWPQ